MGDGSSDKDIAATGQASVGNNLDSACDSDNAGWSAASLPPAAPRLLHSMQAFSPASSLRARTGKSLCKARVLRSCSLHMHTRHGSASNQSLIAQVQYEVNM